MKIGNGYPLRSNEETAKFLASTEEYVVELLQGMGGAHTHNAEACGRGPTAENLYCNGYHCDRYALEERLIEAIHDTIMLSLYPE